MDYPTYAELKANIENQLDLNEETFITAAEFLNYFNEAVDMVEADIHSVYEDYFLTSAPLSLVTGTSAYSLPSNIYMQKIRAILYDDGSTKYQIKKIRKMDEIPFIQSGDYYQFLLTNASATAGQKLTLYPAARETSSTFVTIWYLRNANKFALDADKCDIPEFSNVILQYVRWKCHAKEGHPDSMQDQADLGRMRELMIQTLTNRVPDEDTQLQLDFSFYGDFDADRFHL